MPRDAAVEARMQQSRKSRKDNRWLNGLELDEYCFEDLFGVQNTYVVQLDEHPDMGHAFRILLWDYDRLWGRFDFGHTKGILLIDPGVDPALYDEDDGQELPFTWRGVPKAEPNIFLCNELNTKGKIRITPWERRIEGFFEFIMGNGQAGERFRGDKCAFHAKPHFGPSVVPYTLSDTVELWNYYLPYPVKEAKVRQFLSPSDLEADLRRRDGGSAITTDDEVNNNISVISQVANRLSPK
jgi:hypothetical protein